MKKILIWGMTDTVGGIESVIWNYISHISASDIQVDFIHTYNEISIEKVAVERGSKIISLPSRKKNIIEYKKRINEFMKEHAMEYCAVWLNDCMFGNIDILILAKRYKIPVRIAHAHNSSNMGGGISRLIRHKINSYLLQFIATDFWTCSLLAAEWSFSHSIKMKNSIKVIHNAIDISKFVYNHETRDHYRKKLDVEKKLVFGHVGRFHFQKNHRFLIKIFSDIHKIEPNAVLLLIGDGEDKEKIINWIAEYRLDRAVKVLGVREDVSALYQAMDAFIFPSLFEGFPVVMVEAQTAGLPCFVSKEITNEADISGNVEFYPLSMESNIWASKIICYIKQFKRKDLKDVIEQKGYSIDKEAQKLERFFKEQEKYESWDSHCI